MDNTQRPRRSDRHRPAPRRRSARDISSLGPSSKSSETMRQANRRRTRAEKVVSPAAAQRRRRRILTWTAVTVVLLLLAGAVGAFAYMRRITDKINSVFNSNPELAALLQQDQPSAPTEPFYMVLMGSDTRSGETQQRSDSLMVARIDPVKKKIQLISIPRDSRVDIPGHGTTKINAAAAYGGPTLVIKTVKELTGLPISHYVNINFRGFRDVVDAIGGVWVNVDRDIYDTQASAFGKKYATLKKGYQKLDGAHALTFARTRHFYAAGDYQRMKNQQTLIKAIAKQALSMSSVFRASAIIDAVADNLDTDMTPAQLADLALQFKGMDSKSIESATAPSAPKYIDGVSYVILNDTDFSAMISRMKKGQPLEPAEGSTEPTVTVKPSSFDVTVRNGAGVSGLGKQCGDYLTSKGLKIKGTPGNMNQYVYGRTLIVYQKGHENEANFTRETLGFGDVIPSAGMYSFDTDVMVVIGKDWRNPATISSGQ